MTLQSTPPVVPTVPANRSLKVFDQGFLDIKDPVDFAGVRQPKFSVAQTYCVETNTELPAICDELYAQVYNKLKAEAVGKVTYVQRDYLDYHLQNQEAPRKYIIVEYDTPRGTKSSIFVRFLPFGDNLYVGVDSFVLGALDLGAIIWRVLFTIVPLLLIFGYLSVTAYLAAFTGQFSPYGQQQPSGPGAGTFLCCIVPLLTFVIFLWLDVVRAFRQHGNFVLALRQNFNHAPSNRSFNTDDVLMFFKSALPLVVFSVQDIFKGRGLPYHSLDEFASTINQVVNISSGGGFLSIIGSAIAGQNNTVSS